MPRMNNISYIEYNDDFFDNLVIFFKRNDNSFYDSFSKHVIIKDYVRKLVTFGKVLLALNDDGIVGFAGGYMNDNVNHNCFFQILLVNSQYSSQGIGTQLIKEFIITSIDHGMKKVFLTVDDDNIRAQNLYIKMGFSFIEDASLLNKKKKRMVKDLFCDKNIVDTKFAQKRLLEMAKTITNVLENNKIKYMLAFGSLLGAVRHKGFIPWDDDFDLFLFDDDYKLAVSLLRKELPNNMFVECADTEPKYFHSWAHVKDMNTVCECSQYPQDGIYKHKGLSIDLYKLFPMKLKDVPSFRQKEYLEYLKRKYEIGIIDKNNYETQMLSIQKTTPTVDGADIDVFGMTLNESYIEEKDVFPLRKYAFEDSSFYGPSNYDNILNHFYNNSYLELPKENKRVPHYDIVYKIF